MPSSHSGSSHSSSSHSSSSHSSGGFSSHSSSSHSSSWSSSGHSSSWGSSGGSLWGSSSRSASRGPSTHSQTSRSSALKYRSHYVRDGSMQGKIIQRTRTNQPGGYVAERHYDVNPVTHYCVHHNYLYYPFSWTDEATGAEYKKGYYDEDGKYYESVVFRKDGQYKNVVCQCEFCDTITKIDWTEGGPLICPQCGGTMKILSALDEYTRDPQYDSYRLKSDYVDYGNRNQFSYSRGGSSSSARSTLAAAIAVIAFIIMVTFVFFGQTRSQYEDARYVLYSGTYYRNGHLYDFVEYNDGTRDEYLHSGDVYSPGGSDSEPLSNPALFGSVIFLSDMGDSVYAITDDDNAYDRQLIWNEDEQSYYEEASKLWAWFNTDVEPPLWQYWYEPISGDYGDYGWMEYEDGTWYIEQSRGNWIELPEKYDSTPLWRIDPDSVQEALKDAEVSTSDFNDSGEDLHLSNPELFGNEIALIEGGPGIYRIAEEGGDKVLIWKEQENSYHDEATGLWLWYNTTVEPPLWQYWYEPISGDFGDFGWMEYEDGTWYIEIDAGVWIELPEEYDSTALWHIDTN